MALNAKQKVFCDEYLIDLNATQAAIRAGYSHRTAYSIGQRLLKNVEIETYIAERMAEKDAKRIATQDEVLEYLTNVLRGATQAEIVVVENVGNYMSEARTMQKAPDEKERLRAAELLGKRYGLWDKKQEADTEQPDDGFVDALRGEVEAVWRGE